MHMKKHILAKNNELGPTQEYKEYVSIKAMVFTIRRLWVKFYLYHLLVLWEV